jgi:hypothetical protein
MTSGPPPPSERRPRKHGIVIRLLAVLAVLAGVLLALFGLNGAVLAPRNRPVTGTTAHPAGRPPDHGSRVRILTYNIAKLFIHRGELSFEPVATARARLARIAGIIRDEHPDLVFLEEVVYDCALCPVNQVVELAEGTGMHFWAFGENYDVGIPHFRLSGGNAILSR